MKWIGASLVLAGFVLFAAVAQNESNWSSPGFVLLGGVAPIILAGLGAAAFFRKPSR